MKFPLFRSLAALFAATLVPAQTPAPFSIGTWNLEFLGAEGDFRNHLPPRDDADLQKLGDRVRELGVAVLAVQEICGEAPLQKLATAAGASWRILLGTTGSWDDGKTSQSIGFVYDNAQVELLQAEELMQFPRALEGVPIFHRVPVTACFRHRRTGFDFRMVTVHLKAGQKPVDEQKRRLEATTLAAWLRQLQTTAGEDEDVVLLGDFNSTYGSEPETVIEGDGTMTYLEPKNPTPTIMHFKEPIDQVVASKGFGELRADSFAVHSDFDGLTKDAWRKIYSDHFPVTATIAASGDQDANATFQRGPAAQALPAAARAAAEPGATRPADQAGAWPPTVGSQVRVHLVNHFVEGRLLRDLPPGPGGWIVIEANGETIAISMGQVQKIGLK